MSSVEDRVSAEAVAAIRDWLMLQLAKLEEPPEGCVGTRACSVLELNSDPDLQAAFALTRVYEEALRLRARGLPSH